jgi:hypothetical protein
MYDFTSDMASAAAAAHHHRSGVTNAEAVDDEAIVHRERGQVRAKI